MRKGRRRKREKALLVRGKKIPKKRKEEALVFCFRPKRLNDDRQGKRGPVIQTLKLGGDSRLYRKKREKKNREEKRMVRSESVAVGRLVIKAKEETWAERKKKAEQGLIFSRNWAIGREGGDLILVFDGALSGSGEKKRVPGTKESAIPFPKKKTTVRERRGGAGGETGAEFEVALVEKAEYSAKEKKRSRKEFRGEMSCFREKTSRKGGPKGSVVPRKRKAKENPRRIQEEKTRAVGKKALCRLLPPQSVKKEGVVVKTRKKGRAPPYGGAKASGADSSLKKRLEKKKGKSTRRREPTGKKGGLFFAGQDPSAIPAEGGLAKKKKERLSARVIKSEWSGGE